MKILTCDICGREVIKDWDLMDIIPDFQTEEIRHICSGCNIEVSEIARKIDEVIRVGKSSWMKRVFQTLKDRKAKA